LPAGITAVYYFNGRVISMFDVTKFSLSGKTAIVTGGGTGIGKAIAMGLAGAGAKVAIASRKMENLEATANEIKSQGGEAFPIRTHMGRMEEMREMVDTVMTKYGRIDILVNNAGANPALAGVLETEEKLWEAVMGVNLKGVYFICQAVARIMKNQGRGKIINIASIDAYKPEPNLSAYSISKAGVLMVTRCFAAELAPYNIQVNTINPGPFATRMLESRWFNLSPEEAKKEKAKFEKMFPMGRIGDPDEIAGAVVYLASDLSSYTTGAEISIDGGLSFRFMEQP
jgi:NAD(P)-dependent dehydrogenase (short-subunit alcohol dehydrogenase family)